jgi:pimeloyl-ACP methyl ester carboxylesterase
MVIAGLASRYHLILIDIRGHGYSGTPLTGYTTRDLSLDLNQILDHLEIKCAHVIGHSYGGAVALHHALLHPERVASLVLADARIRSLQPKHGFSKWARWAFIRDNLANNGIHVDDDAPDGELKLLEDLARHRLNGAAGSLKPEHFFVPFMFGSTRRARQWLKLVSETTAMEDFRTVAGLTPERIRNVDRPTLAIYGELSHCLPSLQALTELLPDCTNVIVKSVGHFHPLVKPKLFLYHVLRFLREVELRASAGNKRCLIRAKRLEQIKPS